MKVLKRWFSCFMYFCTVFLEGMAEMINIFGVLSVFISFDLLSYKVRLVFGFLPVSFLFLMQSLISNWQPCFFVCTTSYVFACTVSFLILIYLFAFAWAGLRSYCSLFNTQLCINVYGSFICNSQNKAKFFTG